MDINNLSLEQRGTVIAELLNVMGSQKEEGIIKGIAKEHKTNQQCFTRLCVKWLQYVATDEYQTDLRNEDSQRVGKLIMKGLAELGADRFDLGLPYI